MVSFDICEGNIGALTFLMEAYDIDMWGAESAFQRMQQSNITGSKLYMLWNDCCDRDTAMTIKVMKNHTIEILFNISIMRTVEVSDTLKAR